MINNNGVLICGFYGNNNLGDEAMLVGMMELLHQHRKDLSFTVFSNDPGDTASRYAVQSIHRLDHKHASQRFLEMLQNQYFILGGGDLIRDSASSSVASRWLYPLKRAIQLRRRTMVLGISVGEISRPETKELIPQVLNKVNLLAVRDEHSKVKLENLGVNNTIHVMSDLALHSLPATLSKNIRHSQQPLQIGISVRHLTGRGASIDIRTYPTFQKEMAAIADYLFEKHGATIHFLPFRSYENSYHSTDDDYVSTLDLLRYSRHSANFVIHRHLSSLQSLNQVISSLDLMIGMRLHSLILSAGLGIPIIAAEYDPKVCGFMQEIEQAEASIPLGSFSKDRVLHLAEAVLSDLTKASENVKQGVGNYRQKRAKVQQVIKQILLAT